nr:hypothetical protein CFP56_44232 [Quercus suber]
MPPKKKNAAAQASLGEEHQVEVSVDHVSMHTEGTKSSEEVRQPKPREELYSVSVQDAWVKDGLVVLPNCKHETTEEEKRGAICCRYHKKSDHHTMDCDALRNIFHEKVPKGDLAIKNVKHIDQRMHRLEVAMVGGKNLSVKELKQQFNCEIDNNGDSRFLTYILN